MALLLLLSSRYALSWMVVMTRLRARRGVPTRLGPPRSVTPKLCPADSEDPGVRGWFAVWLRAQVGW